MPSGCVDVCPMFIGAGARQSGLSEAKTTGAVLPASTGFTWPKNSTSQFSGCEPAEAEGSGATCLGITGRTAAEAEARGEAEEAAGAAPPGSFLPQERARQPENARKSEVNRMAPV